MAKMEILHLLSSPAWSGPTENVALLARAQRELGHRVSVAVDRKRTSVASEELCVPRLRELGLLNNQGLELSVKSSPAQMFRDSRRLKALKLDVIHCHFTHDHILARWSTPKNAVLIRSIHAPRSIRWALPWADAFTVSNRQDKESLDREGVELLPPILGEEYVAAEDRRSLRHELGLKPGWWVGMVSTFQRSRRHEIGVAAFAELIKVRPEARLLLLGDGERVETIRAQVRQLKLDDKVLFVGYRKGLDFAQWLRSLDAIWVLGLGNDWSGRVAAQARACDVRVVAVDEGALSQWADQIIAQPDPRLLVSATLNLTRAPISLLSRRVIADRVVSLYHWARAQNAS